MSNCEYKAKIDFQTEMLKKDDFLFKYFNFQTEQKRLIKGSSLGLCYPNK